MSKPTEYEVIDTMTRLGGSFVQQLARLYSCADEHNQKRIREAFRHEWSTYEDLALMRQGKNSNAAWE
jgi:hypothetical protein